MLQPLTPHNVNTEPEIGTTPTDR